MELQVADYVILGLVVVMAVLGLFRGFSGIFAFVAGFAVSAAVTALGWWSFLRAVESVWARGVAAVVLFIVAFAIVRFLVKYIVGKLLTQPSDAIFGVCFGIFCGALLVWTAAGNPDLRSYSRIASAVYSYAYGGGGNAESGT